MGVENITASQLLEMASQATANAAAKPAFSLVLREIERSAGTRQRLVFDLLAAAARLLAANAYPADEVLWAVMWRRSVEEGRLSEYLSLLSQVTTQYFEYLRRVPPDGGVHPWVVTLAIALEGIRELDQDRFRELIQLFREQCRGHADARAEILQVAQEIIPPTQASAE